MKSCPLLLGVVPLGLVACSLAYPTDALSERFSDRPMDGGLDAFDGAADDGNKPPTPLCEESSVVASNVEQGRALAVYGSNLYWLATVRTNDQDVAALYRLEWNTKAILRLNPYNFDQRISNPAERGFQFDTLAVGPNLDQAASGIAFTWTGSQSLYMDASANTDQRDYKCQLPAAPRYLVAVGKEIYAALDLDTGQPQVLQVGLGVGKKTDATCDPVLQTRGSPSELSGKWQGFAVDAMSTLSATWIYQVGIQDGRPGIFRWDFRSPQKNSEALYWPEGGPPGVGSPPRFQGVALAEGYLYFVEDAQRVRRLRLPPEGAAPSAVQPETVYQSPDPFQASAIAVVPESDGHSVVWSEQGKKTIRGLRCRNPSSP